MNLKLEIRRNSDGVIATDTDNWKGWQWNEWWWAEGNAACDCNRHDFFCNAMKIDEEEGECGRGKYSVRCSDNDTGEVLYSEMG